MSRTEITFFFENFGSMSLSLQIRLPLLNSQLSEKSYLRFEASYICSAKRIDDVYARITISIYSMRNFSLIDVFSTQFTYNQIFIDNLHIHIQSDTDRRMTQKPWKFRKFSEHNLSSSSVAIYAILWRCCLWLFLGFFNSMKVSVLSNFNGISPPRWAIKIVSLLPFWTTCNLIIVRQHFHNLLYFSVAFWCNKTHFFILWTQQKWAEKIWCPSS